MLFDVQPPQALKPNFTLSPVPQFKAGSLNVSHIMLPSFLSKQLQCVSNLYKTVKLQFTEGANYIWWAYPHIDTH